MLRNSYIKNIVLALAVVFLGFILLNVTFLFNFLVFKLLDLIIPGSFIATNGRWFLPARHALFMVIIGLISWPIFRSKLNVLVKAIYMTVPVAVFLVTVGILLYKLPVLPYIIGGLCTLAMLYYFYRTKQPWLYYYSVIVISLALMIFTLLGGAI